MLTKLFMKILLKNKDSYIRAVNLSGKTYVINIEEYTPINDKLKHLTEKVFQ